MTFELTTLRGRLRRLRSALPATRQESAAKALFEKIRREEFFHTSRRVAFYMAFSGEISPAPLMRCALASGKRCFLPVVVNETELDFVRYEEGAPLAENRWGISEPARADRRLAAAETNVRPGSLDLVFVPLVGFTRDCRRLGAGGGYYDRAFAFRLKRPGSGPKLVGLAHDCQLLEDLPMREWDMPLDAVATPRHFFRR